MPMPARVSTFNIRHVIEAINRHPDGAPIPYQYGVHDPLLYDTEPRRGDIVWFYKPEDTPLSIGDTKTIDGLTYYVVYSNYFDFGNKKPYFRYALLSQYSPPTAPIIDSARWGPEWSGKAYVDISSDEYRYLKHFEAYESFDRANWHFIGTTQGKFMKDEMPPLENTWYKFRAVDIFERKSAFSREVLFQAQWTRIGNNPILSPVVGPAWDDWGVAAPALEIEGDTMHLFYMGFNNLFQYRIGHATMPYSDWIRGNYTNWTRDIANPVIGPAGAGYMAVGVGESTLTRIGSFWFHYYTGYQIVGPNVIGQGIGVAYAASLLGPWTVFSNTVPRIGLGAGGEWDDFDVWGCNVLQVDSKLRAWYSGGADNTNKWQIGYADVDLYSPLDVFTKGTSNPVLIPSATAGDWDDYFVGFPLARKYGTFIIFHWNGGDGQPGIAGTFQVGSAWSGGPSDTIFKTPYNPDFTAWTGLETSLQIGIDLWREPGKWKWFMAYGSTDDVSTPPASGAWINLAILRQRYAI